MQRLSFPPNQIQSCKKRSWYGCVCVCPKQKDSRLIVHLFFPRYNCFRVHPLFLDHVATGYGGYPPNGPGRTAKSHRVSFRTKESEQERERERRESNCNGLLAWNLQICLEMYVGGFRWASEAERGLLDVEFAEEDQKEPPLVNRGSLLSFAYCSMKKNTRQFINSKHLL